MPDLYVTTPIYYPNDAPHIGHAYTTVVGDAITRWHRALGWNVKYLTGTDEHGLKIQRAAEANNLDPREQADRFSQRFKDAWAGLDVLNDDFIRTTEPRHYQAVQKLLQTVYDNGYIEKKDYEGWYCVPCEAYYTEAELVDGNCPIHGKPVELLKEENYFFKLSAFEDKLLAYFDANPDFVVPESKRNEALGFIKSGLQDFSISRTSITWGVPIPWDSKHVTYVWFDALTNYLTAIGYADGTDEFKTMWPVVHHLIAKDIIRFHCVYWPAMLMAAGIDPPHQVHVHGYLLVGGEKMSKTKLNQIAPADLVKDFGIDGFRYYFLRDFPFGPDGDVSYERMVERYNSDLANNLGNLYARVATVVEKKCNGIAPKAQDQSPLKKLAATAVADTAAGWQAFAPSDALDATWKLIRETNSYLEDNEPWKLDPGEKVDAVMGDAVEVLRIVTLLTWPAMPQTCETLWTRLGQPGAITDQKLPDATTWGSRMGGESIQKGEPLFPRIRS